MRRVVQPPQPPLRHFVLRSVLVIFQSCSTKKTPQLADEATSTKGINIDLFEPSLEGDLNIAPSQRPETKLDCEYDALEHVIFA